MPADRRTAPPSDDDVVALLTELVGVPSPSGEEGRASQLLVSWMSDHGLDARVDEAGNAVGVKGTGPREVLLLGHIDTFPGELPVRLEGDRLYGRGSVDAKGPLCAFAAAAAAIEVPAEWCVTVVGAVEEEAATSRGARHALRERAGSPPSYCVIGEPSRWDRITVGYRGRLLLDVTLRASLSHSAGPEPTLAERGIALWHAVEAFAGSQSARDTSSSTFESLSPSLRAIATKADGAYGTVELAIGFRLPPAVVPDELENQLVDLLARSLGASAEAFERHDAPTAGAHARSYRLTDRAGLPDGLELSCRVHGSERAVRAGKSNPLVRAFLAAIRSEGGTPRFVLKSGTSDMNVVGPPWPQTPILAYGPGDSALDHTPREHVDIPEYLRAIKVLRRAVESLF